MNASKTIADHIKRCALRELQNADAHWLITENGHRPFALTEDHQ